MKKIIILSSNVILMSAICFGQNVGIGTTTPSNLLTVKSPGIGISQESPDGLTKIGFYTTNGNAYLQTHSNNDLLFSTNNGTIQLVLKTNGNFGIRNNTPNASLSVGRGTGTDGTAAFFGTTNVSHFNYSTTEDTYIRAGKNNANVIINDIPGGKTGIGMSSPTRATLEQYGSVGATAAIFGGDGTGISLQKNWPAIGFNSYLDASNHRSIAQGYGAQLGLDQTNGSLYLVSFPYSGVPNTLFSSYTQRFFITRFGDLGLGTDAPQAPLHIKSADNARIRLEKTGTSANWDIFSSEFNLVGGFFVGPALCFYRPGTSVVQACIDYDGAYYYDSDKNVKKNIEYMTEATCINKIMQLKPAKYNMKEDTVGVHKSFGFISQDVETIFPEMVKNADGVKLMGYTKFIPILTKGIQEQQQQIEELKKEVAELKRLLLSKK